MGDISKAGLLNRGVAAMIDLIFAAALSALPSVGFFASILYLLIKDGFAGGQSIGKRLVGLKTILLPEEKAAGFRESILRNLPLAASRLLWAFPILGWLAGGLVILFEGLLVVGSHNGRRLGDELAKTQVVEGS